MENWPPRPGFGRGRGVLMQRSDPQQSIGSTQFGRITTESDSGRPRSAGNVVEFSIPDSSSSRRTLAQFEDISVDAEDASVPPHAEDTKAVTGEANIDAKETNADAKDSSANAGCTNDDAGVAIASSAVDAESNTDAGEVSATDEGENVTTSADEVIVIDAEFTTDTDEGSLVDLLNTTHADKASDKVEIGELSNCADSANVDIELSIDIDEVHSGTDTTGISKQLLGAPITEVKKLMCSPQQATSMEIEKHMNGINSENGTTAATEEVTGLNVISKPDCIEKFPANETKTTLSAVENPISMLKTVPYVPVKDNRPSAPEVLAEYAKIYDGIDIKYCCTVIKGQDENSPTKYKVIVKAGFRGGEGIGGTVSEAKALAAEECLKDLQAYAKDGDIVEHRPVVRTNPHKDILFLLEGMCRDYGIKIPLFTLEPKETTADDGQFQYGCSVGTYTTQAKAGKKRVAIRKAAVNMYNLIRDNYNAGTLAVSAYED